MRLQPLAIIVAVTLLLSIAAPAAYAVVYDEGVSGDLSSNPSAPTSLGVFGVGTHSVTATSSGAEQDDYTFNIPAGLSLTQIINFSFNSPLADNTAFIGIASGTAIPNQGLAPGNLLGYTHFGPNFSTVGTNILDDIAVGPGAIGFAPPLGPGNYSIWSQQAGNPATFRMDFVVIPEPTSLALIVLGLCALCLRRDGLSRA
jgi:hypothetical protein